MCGIGGWKGSDSEHKVRAIIEAQAHRGPDEFGIKVYMEDNYAIGMNRLAIIDLGGGKQPMSDESGRYTLVFNGEIFNSAELRVELERVGICFKSQKSDTEVLLQWLIRHGVEGLSTLNGMFAFAMYDRKSKTTIIARDRLGIKPLFYHYSSNSFGFSSEIRSLRRSISNESIDVQSMASYMALGYVYGRGTSFNEIKRLQPGSLIVHNGLDNTISLKKWWQPERIQSSRDDYEWKEAVWCALERSVSRWSISDAQLSLSLSGGLDSSVIAYLLHGKGIGFQDCFSVGFHNANPKYSLDLVDAKRLANSMGLSLHKKVIDKKQFQGDLRLMVNSLEEPYAGGVPSWYVYEEASSKHKVILTGTGGDELFGNYGKWAVFEKRYLKMFSKTRNCSTIGKSEFVARYFNRFCANLEFESMISDDYADIYSECKELLVEEFYNIFVRQEDIDCRDGVMILDMSTQLPYEFLAMTDRFSMNFSVEARTPFLDNELVDLMLECPSAVRSTTRDAKRLLRSSCRHKLPGYILRSKKRGFVAPDKEWSLKYDSNEMNTKEFLKPVKDLRITNTFENDQALVRYRRLSLWMADLA